MTPVSRFRRQYEQAIKTLIRGLPEATIYVVSIPDVYRLWEILHTDAAATQSWRAFRTCQSLLAESNDEDDRQVVRRRVIEFNQVLEDVCVRYGSCRWVGGEVFRYAFDRADVSPLDYFHPSAEGQSRLAEVTWRHGPLAS
jgi:hypothetical protein